MTTERFDELDQVTIRFSREGIAMVLEALNRDGDRPEDGHRETFTLDWFGEGQATVVSTLETAPDHPLLARPPLPAGEGNTWQEPRIDG